MIDIIALEKPLDEALSREELCIMLSKLEENFYPFEVEGEFRANRFVFSKHKREAGISFVFEKYKRYRHSI